ncbi:ergothioneine biosynthesis protein EgtB [Wenyingzhuangia heitensis]|uniref:Ergothioneine biosynthesis protein EgtB n=1 Tax=Wenyingzhuangia heitensis TaxID=1487859 RepID=A0ABX0U9Z0_9FLAO|nr:ergothioneine biosynthesis protein EgtB [Wenyingzhuangia heitensis]NIJ45637.1 ergothioneine biosynthesis protein EgtB [Wenyingzhuangia heitensis]
MTSLKQQYQEVRSYTQHICKPLKTEDYVVQVADFASPAKWHLAHTTWFFETFILIPNLENYTLYNSDFSFLFNSYYNNAGDRVLRANRGNMTRPTVDEVYSYRKYVDDSMIQLLENKISIEIQNLLTLGLNHEQQHQELLLTDIKYMFGQNPLFPPYNTETTLLDQEQNTESGYVKIEEGVYKIGYKNKDFCFDNELGVHKVYLHKFEISKGLVTNKEYIEFIEANGYSNFNLWLDEGWSWVQKNKKNAPLYWHKIKNDWFYYTLKGFKKVDPNNILKHISFYEAMAFAEWKGMRLPTEFEWEIASSKLNWGQRWEWTNSTYLPYPNFKKAAGAIGEYNGKFMINQMVLRGASIATSSNHSRPSYRNFFHAQEQWQFTGIRLVK